MNPFNRPKTPFPRVTLPGVDQGEVEALQESLDYNVRQRRGFLLAMIRTGKPFANRTGAARKRKRETAHVRQKRARMERAAYLRA